MAEKLKVGTPLPPQKKIKTAKFCQQCKAWSALEDCVEVSTGDTVDRGQLKEVETVFFCKSCYEGMFE